MEEQTLYIYLSTIIRLLATQSLTLHARMPRQVSSPSGSPFLKHTSPIPPAKAAAAFY